MNKRIKMLQAICNNKLEEKTERGGGTSMNETGGWTITQEGRTVRIRDKDGLTVAKFEHDPLTEDELETMLNIYKCFFKEIARRLDEYILNGG